LLALVSEQDRSTCTSWQHAAAVNGCVKVLRTKKKVGIEIPVSLHLNAIGMSLADVVARCRGTGVVRKYLIHCIGPHAAVQRGRPFHPNTTTIAPAKAREFLGITGEDAPSFHEIHCMSKRLHEKPGGVDTKALLGHLIQTSADLYVNSPGTEPIHVKATT
jgi:enterobacteria phage integrase